MFGPQDARNPLPGGFYVLLWVGLVALSLVVGPVWRAISPVRNAHRLLGRRSLGRRYPDWAGYWPAAVGLFAFVWLELASPDPGSLGATKIWLLVYLAVTLAGALCCGERWCRKREVPPARGLSADRAAGDDAGDGRLHVHRALSVVRRIAAG